MYMLLSAVLELTESSVAPSTRPCTMHIRTTVSSSKVRGPRQPTHPHSVGPPTHGHKPRHHYHGRVTSLSLLVRVGPGSPESGLTPKAASKAASTMGVFSFFKK